MAANTREIRRRIRSIENTRQITKAMEMVAATKMRRAQQRVQASRAYADAANAVLRAVADSSETAGHPLLTQRPVKRTAIVVMASDRGLVGGMNTNLLRAVTARAKAETNPVFVAVGRKALSIRHTGQLIGEFENIADAPEYVETRPIGALLTEEFVAGSVDRVLLAYPKFVSTLRNEPTIEQLLPAVVEEDDGGEPTISAQTLFEPSPEAVLENLVPRLVETRIYQALLELKASEHSSQMIAMRNATDNASDLIDSLKFTYNQARQAAITTEIAEISAAAAASE